jgi:protein-tyrosine phosphatase
LLQEPLPRRRHSQRPDKTSPHYLTEEYQEDGREHLCLNMIDSPAPLFDMELFERSVIWTRKQIVAGKKVMIHCNQGESRAPSVALVISAMLLGLVTIDSYRGRRQRVRGTVGHGFHSRPRDQALA